MKFSMSIPLGDITPGEFQSAQAVGEMSRAMEAAGIDACYVTDHPAPSAQWLHANGHDALDPFTASAFVAAATSRLRMHTNIIVLPYRNPFLTAKAAATLQVLSGGRLILGVGGGYQAAEFEALGVEFRKRGALFDEALEVMRLAWAGGAVVHQGSNFNAVGNEPWPVPPTQPPIWIGGGSGKAVERAALKGDGWSPFFAAPTMTAANQASGIHTVEQLGEAIAQVKDLRAAHGLHSPFDFSIGARAKLTIGDGESAEKYVAAVRELEAVGITWTMIELPHPSRRAFIDSVQWFGEAIVAKLRG